MYSNFDVNTAACFTCNNGVMKALGKLQGVFGAKIDFINKKVLVNHTDEVSSEEIANKLKELGLIEI